MLSKYLEPFICKIKHNFWKIGATFQNNVSCTQCLAQNKVSGLDARAVFYIDVSVKH